MRLWRWLLRLRRFRPRWASQRHDEALADFLLRQREVEARLRALAAHRELVQRRRSSGQEES